VQTVAGVQTFFLAMVCNPEVVAKAQKELDSVTGGDRLPDFNDRPRLPYINAILKETMRWQPVTRKPNGCLFSFRVFIIFQRLVCS
jgi:cytochrome P450